jgi:hypothetical protein
MSDERNREREARVRELAYQRWEAEGRPAGRHEDHWHDAARAIDAEQDPPIAAPSAQAAAATTPDAPAKPTRSRKAAAPKPAVDPAPSKPKRAVKPKAK